MNEERKLLNVYKGVLDIFQALEKAKSEEEVVELYVEYLKLQIQLSTNYPKLEANPEVFKYGNCYTYALGLKCPEIFWHKYKSFYKRGMDFDVGLVSKKKLYVGNYNETMLLDSFYRDCDDLNIDVYSGNGLDFISKHNGTIIIMFKNINISRNYDYHFVRVNNNGFLSHKMGHNGEIHPLRNLQQVSSRYELVQTFEIVKPVIRERGL